jgi:hypothetical protein
MKLINFVFAQDGLITNPVIDDKFGVASTPGSGAKILGTLLGNVFIGMIIAGAIILIIMIIWAGISWASSGSDKEKLQGAQHRLTHAIVGFIILICVFAIANFVGGFFGLGFFKTLKLDFPTP